MAADPRPDVALAVHAEWIRAFDDAAPGGRPARATPLPPLAPRYRLPTPDTELRADRDALLAAYGAVLHELAALTLATASEDAIRERLDDVFVLTLPPAVNVDLRAELNRLRGRCRELGITPDQFIAPAGSRRLAS